MPGCLRSLRNSPPQASNGAHCAPSPRTFGRPPTSRFGCESSSRWCYSRPPSSRPSTCRCCSSKWSTCSRTRAPCRSCCRSRCWSAYGAAARRHDAVRRAARRRVREAWRSARSGAVALQTFRHLHGLSLRFISSARPAACRATIERGTRGIETLLSFMLFTIIPTHPRDRCWSAASCGRCSTGVRGGHVRVRGRSTSATPSRSPSGAWSIRRADERDATRRPTRARSTAC